MSYPRDDYEEEGWETWLDDDIPSCGYCGQVGIGLIEERPGEWICYGCHDEYYGDGDLYPLDADDDDGELT